MKDEEDKVQFRRKRVFDSIKPPTVELRDYFAAAVLTGIVGSHDWLAGIQAIVGGDGKEDALKFAKAAYVFADAMIEARDK